MRTCLRCARYVFQQAEIGIGSEADVHAVMRCSRDRWCLNMLYATKECVEKALLSADTCDQFYDAKALSET